MEDQDIYRRIRELVGREHEVRDNPDATPEDRAAEVRRVEEALDQCWDLLRQRRALREAGADAGQAVARPVDEVEHYSQ
jgi:hypothetical protein